MARSLRQNDIDNYNGTQVPGYYQRTNLNNIINNFIVAYTGEGKALTSVPRHEVAFWAQRAVQEFSYDILHSEKSMEVELSDALTMKLPPDYVNYVRLTRTDMNGNTVTLKPSLTTKANKAVLQDNNYEPIFDENGDIVFAETSEAIQRYQTNRYDQNLRIYEYYDGYYYDDDFAYFNYWRQKRFGLQTHLANQDLTYLIDNEAGIIYFDQDWKQDDIVTLFYISDGLANGDDLDNVYVPKLAEDAIYADVLFNLVKLRPTAAGGAAIYQKEAMAKKRNAKIRLMNMKSQEMIDVMRGKSKWIKH